MPGLRNNCLIQYNKTSTIHSVHLFRFRHAGADSICSRTNPQFIAGPEGETNNLSQQFYNVPQGLVLGLPEKDGENRGRLRRNVQQTRTF